jgi:hypothetical protein
MVEGVRKSLEEMAPHIAKIKGAVRINDEWGRVVIGQTEAATELARIFDAALASIAPQGGEGAE